MSTETDATQRPRGRGRCLPIANPTTQQNRSTLGQPERSRPRTSNLNLFCNEHVIPTIKSCNSSTRSAQVETGNDVKPANGCRDRRDRSSEQRGSHNHGEPPRLRGNRVSYQSETRDGARSQDLSKDWRYPRASRTSD